jgi:hypothetical protein
MKNFTASRAKDYTPVFPCILSDSKVAKLVAISVTLNILGDGLQKINSCASLILSGVYVIPEQSGYALQEANLTSKT